MIELKRLTENELELLMNWRMSEAVDSMMFTSVKLTLEGQRHWFETIKNSTSEIRWIIWNDGQPVGSMYFVDIDLKNKRCESGWFIAEKSGLGLKDVIAIQQNSYDYAFDVLKLNRVYGYVLECNKSLLRLLKCCGINFEGTLKEHIIKNNEKYDVFVVGLTKNQWNNLKQSSSIDYPKFSIE